MEALWPIITIVGPLLLVAAIVWAVVRNKAGSARDEARADTRADAGSRRLYAEEDRRSDD